MASVTKTFTVQDAYLSSSCDIERTTTPPSGSSFEYRISSVRNDAKTRTFDISEIPAGAQIISATLTFNRASSGGASRVNTLVDNSSTLNDSNILSYLQSLSTFTTLTARFALLFYTGTVLTLPWDNQSSLSSDASYTNIQLTVIYEASDDATVSFGINNTWQKCNVYYGTGGEWVKCKAHFGVDGAWKETQ